MIKWIVYLDNKVIGEVWAADKTAAQKAAENLYGLDVEVERE